LERISFLLESLGNPQKEFPALHISGTNGKGSTLAFLFSIYRKAGYKVGAFTSPHLHQVNERLRVGDEFVSHSELEELIDEVKPYFFQAKKKKELGSPSYFEFLTALAFLYFARKKVDLALVEVGIEGRFGATNLVNPVATIITQIEMEHQDYLGSTYQEVLAEALSIMKEGVPVITAEAKPQAVLALKAEAERKKTRVFFLKENCCYKETDYSLEAQTFNYKGFSLNLENLKIRLLGKHQIENASLALLTTEVLKKRFPVSERSLRFGLEETYWPGRFEILKTERGWLVIDGAHNPAGLEILLQALRRHFPGEKPIFVFGVLKDKDYKKMVFKMADSAREIILLEPPSSRSLSSLKLKGKFLSYNNLLSVKEAKTMKEALAWAFKKGNLVVVTGSLYLVALAREELGLRKDG